MRCVGTPAALEGMMAYGQQAERPFRGVRRVLAERGGFEPPRRYKRLPDFESGTFNHSATSPVARPRGRGRNDTGRRRARQGDGATLWPLPPRLAARMSEITVPVSFGELLDKISILQIKSERMADEAKRANVHRELAALERAWMAHPAAVKDIARLRAELKAVNERLWDIEDEVRLQDRAGTFGPEFVALARSVYLQNDERARIKKAINLALGSAYVEEKSYRDDGSSGAG